MNDKRISELPHLTESKDTDIVPVVDTEDSTTKQQTKGEFLAETEDRQYFTEERAREAVESEGYLKEVNWSEVKEKPVTFPPSAHTHPIDQVTGLQNALDEKANSADLGTMATESADNYYDKVEVAQQANALFQQITSHTSNTDNPHSVTKAQVGLSKVDNTSDAEKPVSAATQLALNAKLDANQKGAANGVAELDESGHVPASQLPSYVDDVLEFDSLGDFPVTGESDKIYIAVDTNQIYRWSGSQYVQISSSLALGETAQTAYRGDRGKIAYDHSQTSGNPHGTTKADIGLGNVDNTPDDEKPVSNPQASALAGKEPTINAGEVGDYFTGSKTWASLAGAVLAIKLAGFTIINSVVGAGDSILVAFGKLQGQINAISSALGGKANTADLKDMAYEDDAPSDGEQYAREDGEWTPVEGGSSPWVVDEDDTAVYEGGDVKIAKDKAYKIGDFNILRAVGDEMYGYPPSIVMGSTNSVTEGRSIIIGQGAGLNVQVTPHTIVGNNAYEKGGGQSNTAFGNGALQSISGVGNLGVGEYAGRGGSGSLRSNVNDNVFVGGQAGYLVGANSSRNTYVGYRAGYVFGSGEDNILLGSNTELPAPSGSHQINIGNTIYGDRLTKRISVGSTTPDLSAILDLQATDRGFLPPRMTETQRDAIATPAEGLVVYNTDTKTIDLYDGTAWAAI